MTDAEIENRIRKLEGITLGDKGYLKTWREPGALGIVVFPCVDVNIGPFGVTTLSSWSVNRAIGLVENDDEDATIEGLINWFDTSENVVPPNVSIQGRFSKWTIEKITAHHISLLDEKEMWNNNRLASEFVFKFMNEFQRERWSKRVLESCGEHSGFSHKFEGDALILSYRWPG